MPSDPGSPLGPPGRTVEPPPAVAAYRRALPEGEVIAYPTDVLDHLGVPTWSAELFAGGGIKSGVGYGTSDERALIGAFGELSESLHAANGIKRMRVRRSSYEELLKDRGRDGVLDPLEACLTAGNDYMPDRPLRWVEARRWGTDEPVLVPLELAAASTLDVQPEGEWLVLPVNNGLGAGPTAEQAMAHGLLELVQRDGNSVTYRALDAGIRIDLDDVRDPGTRDLLDRLGHEGVEVVAKLASTDFGLTNLYVVGAERDPGRAPHQLALTACGEAADPEREKALSKALLEYAASRARKMFDHGPLSMVASTSPGSYVGRALRDATLEYEEERSLRDTIDWISMDASQMRDLIDDPVLAVRSTVEFSSLPTSSAGPERDTNKADLVAGRLREAGFDVLYVDFTSPEGETAGVRVVRAIVPGLEVETASYGRIGARNLRRLLARDDGLVGMGEPPADRPGARRILLPERERGVFEGAAWLDVDALNRTVGRLYPLYREPSRHVATLVAEGVL